MTVPLMALAVGAVVAGFFGVPAALGGANAIEHFLEPSFTASGAHAAPAQAQAAPAGEAHGAAAAGDHGRRRTRPGPWSSRSWDSPC